MLPQKDPQAGSIQWVCSWCSILSRFCSSRFHICGCSLWPRRPAALSGNAHMMMIITTLDNKYRAVVLFSHLTISSTMPKYSHKMSRNYRIPFTEICSRYEGQKFLCLFLLTSSHETYLQCLSTIRMINMFSSIVHVLNYRKELLHFASKLGYFLSLNSILSA